MDDTDAKVHWSVTLGGVEVAEFQRARSAAQVHLRRQAILTAAREMLGENLTADVSLRELSRRVGLSKSNVVRYFPTREAVFLSVLVQDWAAWLSELETALPPTDTANQRSRKIMQSQEPWRRH